jgi:arylformamidase
MDNFQIIDISQPVLRSTACFPGDVPFSRQLTVDYAESGVINLCAFTMSPHVGTHADAPVHVRGSVPEGRETVGFLPLSPFIGSALVVEVAPWHEEITWSRVGPVLANIPALPPRILFRTACQSRFDAFEPPYASFAPDLVDALASRGVILMGIDTPSVDQVHSKTLDAHHTLLSHEMTWLENLDLTSVETTAANPAEYFLVALPLKMMELDASPVRAVLLQETPRAD